MYSACLQLARLMIATRRQKVEMAVASTIGIHEESDPSRYKMAGQIFSSACALLQVLSLYCCKLYRLYKSALVHLTLCPGCNRENVFKFDGFLDPSLSIQIFIYVLRLHISWKSLLNLDFDLTLASKPLCVFFPKNAAKFFPQLSLHLHGMFLNLVILVLSCFQKICCLQSQT